MIGQYIVEMELEIKEKELEIGILIQVAIGKLMNSISNPTQGINLITSYNSSLNKSVDFIVKYSI